MKLATKAAIAAITLTATGCSIFGGGQAPLDPTRSGPGPVGWIYSTLYSKNAVLEINNLQSRAEKEPITVPNGPRSLAIDPRGRGEFLYVVCELGNTVAIVDRRNRLVNRSIDVGRQPYDIAISPAGERAFVSNLGDDTVSVIDMKSQTVIQTISLRPSTGTNPGAGTTPTQLRPQGIVTNATGTRVYVACQSGQVVMLESATPTGQFSATRTVILSGSVGPQNIAINTDGQNETVYITDPPGNRLFFFNANNQTNTAEVRDITGGPWGVAVGRNPTTNKNDRLYVTVKQPPALLPLTLDTNLSIATSNGQGLSVEGTDPTAVAVSPIGDQVYVSLSGNNTVTVFRREGSVIARPEQFNVQQLRSDFIAPTGDLALGGFLFQ